MKPESIHTTLRIYLLQLTFSVPLCPIYRSGAHLNIYKIFVSPGLTILLASARVPCVQRSGVSANYYASTKISSRPSRSSERVLKQAASSRARPLQNSLRNSHQTDVHLAPPSDGNCVHPSLSPWRPVCLPICEHQFAHCFLVCSTAVSARVYHKVPLEAFSMRPADFRCQLLHVVQLAGNLLNCRRLAHTAACPSTRRYYCCRCYGLD